MAFTDLGSLGATGSTSNNQSTLDLTTVLTIDATSLVVVVCGADNIANGGDDNAVASVMLGTNGPRFQKALQIANALAAQAGASCSVWWLNSPITHASGQIIRATFGSGTLVDASAMVARSFSMANGKHAQLNVAAGSDVSNTGADPASAGVVTDNLALLRVRGIASQVGNNTNLTPTASWTAWANGNSAATGTTSEICARAEHYITTGTLISSNPTYVSAIYASVYAAFAEVDFPFRGVGT